MYGTGSTGSDCPSCPASVSMQGQRVVKAYQTVPVVSKTKMTSASNAIPALGK